MFLVGIAKKGKLADDGTWVLFHEKNCLSNLIAIVTPLSGFSANGYVAGSWVGGGLLLAESPLQVSPKVVNQQPKPKLGGGFKHVLFSSLPGKMIQFDEHIFQMGGSTTI